MMIIEKAVVGILRMLAAGFAGNLHRKMVARPVGNHRIEAVKAATAAISFQKD